MKRPPTQGEKRRLFFADPYGILAPDNEEQTAPGIQKRLEGESVSDYLKRIGG